MKEFWDKLTTSQRRYLSVGGVFVAVFLVFQLAIFPLWDAREKMNQSIRTNERVLKEMAVLGAEYAILKQRAEAVQQALAARAQDFTLFSHLERKAGEIGLKSHIKSINPIKGMTSATYEESIVEMRLDSITMKQLTDFLYTVESPKDFVRISKISVSKMRENPEYLTATMQALTYLPLKAAPSGPQEKSGGG
jgi:type II secretory pathway component PulM